MSQTGRASEELSPMIVYNRDLAGMEADLAVVAAGAIGSADVEIRANIDENKIYPSIPPTLVSIRRQDPREDVTGVNFTYTSEYLLGRMGTGSPRVAKARLQQTSATEESSRVVDDRLVIAPDKSLLRRREVKTAVPVPEDPGRWVGETQNTVKRASSRTVVAMARLAAFHARAGHESSKILN